MTTQRIKVGDNQRYLITEDGRPFFWLGDTAWELFRRLRLEEAEDFFRIRASQGFNVMQAMLISEFESRKEGTENVYGEHSLIDWNPDRPNEKYFAHVDKVFDLADKHGLYIALVPMWGDKVGPQLNSPGPEGVFNPDNALSYGRFLGERYRSRSNLIWLTGGDRTPTEGWHLETWRALARGLREAGAPQLMTYHPRGETSSAWYVHSEDWLQLNTVQSGHARRDNPLCYQMISVDYARQPVKPVLNAEPCYEDHPVNWNRDNGTFLDIDVRRAAYWSVLAGGCGHTYGHYSVFMFHSKERPGAWADPHMFEWREALTRLGALQMKHLRTLFEKYVAKLEPAQHVLTTNRADIRAAKTSDNKNAFVYTPDGSEVEVKAGFMDSATAKWFDPHSGELTEALRKGNQFVPPSKLDWLLWLERP
jgi:hypothetical protein